MPLAFMRSSSYSGVLGLAFLPALLDSFMISSVTLLPYTLRLYSFFSLRHLESSSAFFTLSICALSITPLLCSSSACTLSLSLCFSLSLAVSFTLTLSGDGPGVTTTAHTVAVYTVHGSMGSTLPALTLSVNHANLTTLNGAVSSGSGSVMMPRVRSSKRHRVGVLISARKSEAVEGVGVSGTLCAASCERRAA
jgi:hypothetical protein